MWEMIKRRDQWKHNTCESKKSNKASDARAIASVVFLDRSSPEPTTNNTKNEKTRHYSEQNFMENTFLAL